MELVSKQYTLVKEMRQVLFAYLESLPDEKYVEPVKGFGRGSIMSTQLHIAHTYWFWIGNFGLRKDKTIPGNQVLHKVDEMRGEFLEVNKLIEEFIEKFYNKPLEPITNTISNGKEIALTPLALISHVITHEFHHKGQIVSMGKMLGYQPPDTDLIRL